MSYDDEFDDESEGIMMHINEDGKLEEYKGVSISERDFEKLQKGLELLKEKYPDISKECFPE